jgi:hypothetical protein
MDPELAAIGTAVILAKRYQNQLTPEQRADIRNTLPAK